MVAVSFCIVFAGVETAGAGEAHYLDNGVRDSMNFAEKVRLVMEEDRALSYWKAQAIVEQMDAVPEFESYGVKGSFRKNLDAEEKVLLTLEENKSLTPNRVPELTTEALKTPPLEEPFGLGYHKPYVHGEFRTNLSDAEKEVLKREERYK